VSDTERNDLRVILVGRTGLDAALRLDPGIELVRVQTPLEAVGELASPIDSLSPSRAVVVLAPEVETSLRQPNANEGIEDFVGGLRIADPAVVVMGVTRNGSVGSPPGAGLDATISAELPPDGMRVAIRQQAGVEEELQIEELDEVAPAPVSAAPKQAAGSSSQTKTDDVGDLSLVSLLVKGQELLNRALELVRVRTGDDSAEFIPLNANTTDGPLATDQPVAWEGTVFGHLRARGVPEPVLAVHAHWMAGWLRARDQQAQLRAAAFTDPLTGAYNRRYFDRFLATAIDQARDARRHVTVMVFDIDDFKTYNDRFGHDAGDEILREAVRLMRSVIRPTDRVCRIGGDEFAVIFNEPAGPREEGSQHPKDVFLLAHRFQQQVQQHRFPKLSDCLPGTLSVSGGLATFPWDGTTPEELLAQADKNALQSKRQGKNAITFGPRG
jgi:diguanylate cyclase (GGDEF)-like protein